MSDSDKKEETGDGQDGAWGWQETEANAKKISKDPSPIEEKAPETQTEETEEPMKETAIFASILTWVKYFILSSLSSETAN